MRRRGGSRREDLDAEDALVEADVDLRRRGVLFLRFVPRAWEIANRSSEFLFVGVALMLAFASVRAVSDKYFDALGIPLIQGRYFQPADTATSDKVVIISRTIARQYFPGGDAIGKRAPRPPWKPSCEMS